MLTISELLESCNEKVASTDVREALPLKPVPRVKCLEKGPELATGSAETRDVDGTRKDDEVCESVKTKMVGAVVDAVANADWKLESTTDVGKDDETGGSDVGVFSSEEDSNVEDVDVITLESEEDIKAEEVEIVKEGKVEIVDGVMLMSVLREVAPLPIGNAGTEPICLDFTDADGVLPSVAEGDNVVVGNCNDTAFKTFELILFDSVVSVDREES